MANTLWPNLSGAVPPRGMIEMLYDAAGDIGQLTNGKIDFYIDIVGIGASGMIQDMRHNCYLRVIEKKYLHLFFRVTTPVASPFPASLATPEGETFTGLQSEVELRDAIGQVLQRPRTTEVLLFLLNTVPGGAASISAPASP
jgi:hypothetical protein